VNANKTPYLHRTEARRAERIDGARRAINTADRGQQGRDNSLLRPQDGYFELLDVDIESSKLNRQANESAS